MRNHATTGRGWLASVLTFIAGASLTLSALATQPLKCYALPAPDKVSTNTFVLPDPWQASRPDPWGNPGAPPIAGTFPCAGVAHCDLTTVLAEANVCALLVIKRGNLVHEYYDTANQYCADTDGPNGPGKLFGVASLTKSIVSTAFGHMLSQPDRYGPISLDDTVAAFVPALPPGSHLSAVTLRQALTMTSRIRFDQQNNCLQEWTTEHASRSAQGKTFVEAAGAYPKQDLWLWPGYPFQYSSLDTTLLGMTMEAISGRAAMADRLDEILAELIWTKAGMRDRARWKVDLADSPAPYCCFYATARDMGRLGQHVLDNFKASGNSAATPIHDWIVQATAAQVWAGNRTCLVNRKKIQISYGYQWWHLGGREGFTGQGTGGQFLHILPDDDTVIVQLGSWPTDHWPQTTECNVYAAHRFLVDHYAK